MQRKDVFQKDVLFSKDRMEKGMLSQRQNRKNLFFERYNGKCPSYKKHSFIL